MTTKTEVFAILVGLDDGIIQSYYGVEHERYLWLVTAWLSEHGSEACVPERMIRVDRFQASPEPGSRVRYLNIQLPRGVIEGRDRGSHEYVVRVLPSSPVVSRHQLFPLPAYPYTEQFK